MSKQSSHTRQITRPAAAFRLRQLLDEAGMLPRAADHVGPHRLALQQQGTRDAGEQEAPRSTSQH